MSDDAPQSDHDAPAPTQAIGPTEHLHTVEYWRELYCTAIEVGQEQVDKNRALTSENERLRAALVGMKDYQYRRYQHLVLCDDLSTIWTDDLMEGDFVVWSDPAHNQHGDAS